LRQRQDWPPLWPGRVPLPLVWSRLHAWVRRSAPAPALGGVLLSEQTGAAAKYSAGPEITRDSTPCKIRSCPRAAARERLRFSAKRAWHPAAGRPCRRCQEFRGGLSLRRGLVHHCLTNAMHGVSMKIAGRTRCNARICWTIG
jgi:hypothetical protein